MNPLLHICIYASQNPNNNLEAFEPEERPPARQDCGCDNCFYGRDALAVNILALRALLDRAVLELRNYDCDYAADNIDAELKKL